MRPWPLALLGALGCLGGSPPVSAQAPARPAIDYRLGSTTYLRGAVVPALDESHRRLRFYELVDVQARVVQGFSVYGSFWGAIEAASLLPGEDRASGDVDGLFLSYRAPVGAGLDGLEAKLGRQLVAAGPCTLDQLDGASARYRLPGGLDLQGFGGLVVGSRFRAEPFAFTPASSGWGNDWTVGGRLGYHYGGLLAAGASYRQKRLQRELAFHELGGDLQLVLLDWLELSGSAALELSVGRLKQAHGAVELQPLRRLLLVAGYRFQAPDLFIPRTSIFAVFSDEQQQSFFLEGAWRASRWLSLDAELGGVHYAEVCTGGALAGSVCDGGDLELSARSRAELRLGAEGSQRFSLEVERLGAPADGLWRARLASALRLLERLGVALELELFRLDRLGSAFEIAEVSASRWSFASSAHATLGLGLGLTLLGGGTLMVTPIFRNAAAFTLRLEWQLDRSAASPPLSASSSARRQPQVTRWPAAGVP